MEILILAAVIFWLCTVFFYSKIFVAPEAKEKTVEPVSPTVQKPFDSSNAITLLLLSDALARNAKHGSDGYYDATDSGDDARNDDCATTSGSDDTASDCNQDSGDNN